MSRLVVELEHRHASGATVRAAFDTQAPVTVLFGASGSGKTTVLRCLAGLERPGRGRLTFDGETWQDERRFVPARARRVGLVTQDHALFPHLTAQQNIAYGLHGLDRSQRAERVTGAAALARLDPVLLNRRPAQLSGGQAQRVALARALAPRPRLLLLDEPLSSLDTPTRVALQADLREAVRASAVTTVLVTHDRAEALALGDVLVVLLDGAVRQVGPVDEVFSAPADAEVARLVGTENVTPVRVLAREGGLLQVAVGSARVVAVDPGGLREDAWLCIRAEDVLLERADDARTSARNRLAGQVTALRVEGPLVRVSLDCGFALVALVTRQSAEALGLVPGGAVVALVKAPSARLVPR